MPHISTKHEFFLDVIEDIISQGPSQATTLVLCSTKSDILDQLQTSIQSWQPPRDQIPPSQDEDVDEDADDGEQSMAALTETGAKHAFLTPTLHLLATSQNVRLVFCPSINTLRAYLSAYDIKSARRKSESSTNHQPKPPTQKLVILNLLSLHRDTSEFTVQGLSRTFAVVASMAYRTESQLQLIECRDVRDPTGPMDLRQGSPLWSAEVPLLSGSVKIGGEGSAWAGRTIAVKRVVERWFEFEDET